MNRAWGLLLGLSIVGLAPARALAEPSPRSSDPDDPPPTYEPEYQDYRYQLLAADVASVSLFVTALAIPRHYPTLALSSLGTYLLAPPLIHVGNGQPARGAASLGMRVGLPILGIPFGLIGGGVILAVADRQTDASAALVLGVVGGLFLGGVAAMIVDDGFLGKVELPRDNGARSMTRPSWSVAVLPVADPVRKTYGVSLAGAF